ncbi:MFS transporter TsgA [Solimonas marina]|uniref:MFS transporter TsgA n=1 Tax=Solimonas marina TaxID=2714601 RepID=A0A969WEG8_9GAMM|nr:MFS transporter TsgA [Solimonas marina]NKF24754.1 MFS transporter TsgA [Solimonas marina]
MATAGDFTMTRAQRIRLTLACLLSYFIAAGLISQIGAISGPMAAHFGKALTDVSERFSSLSSGIMIGTLLSLVWFEWSGLKRTIISCYVIGAAVLLAILFGDSWSWLPVLLAVAGAVAGLGLAAAAVTLALSYSARIRAVLLLCTDLCFALAGIVCAPAAAQMISHGLPWSASYGALAALCALVVVLAVLSPYPPSAREAGERVAHERWPLGAWLCAIALLFYLLGQVTMLLWLPQHLQQQLHVDYVTSTAGISRYWTGMAIGQLLLVALLQRLDFRRLLPLIACASVAASFPLWLSRDASALMLATTVLGIVNGGVLKLSLTYATTLVRHPQRVVALLLSCGSLGQALSPYLSSQLVRHADTALALQSVSVCYALMAACIVVAMRRRALPVPHPSPAVAGDLP